MPPELQAFVTRLLQAVQTGDRETLAQLHDPDRLKWHNHDGIARAGGVDETLTELLDDIEGKQRRLIAFDGGFVLQFEMTGVARKTGEAFVSRSCVIIDWSDGRIGNTDEYVDSAAFAPLFVS